MISATTAYSPVLLRFGGYPNPYRRSYDYPTTAAESRIGAVVFILLLIFFIQGWRSLRK